MADLLTSRLLLRQWRPEDHEPFSELNSDVEVMRHFPAPLDRATSDALAERIASHLAQHGWGLWAVEVSGRFAGFTGLNPVPEEVRDLVRGRPSTEVGWRLARWAWGHGYATEAATAALDEAARRGLGEVVSFTAAGNDRSRAVMTRLGMTHDPEDDFDHPRVSEGSPLRRHVLYREPTR